MQFSTFVSSAADIAECAATGRVGDVLLGPEQLCRESRLGKEETFELAAQAAAAGLRPVLVWDVLLPQAELDAALSELSEWDLTAFAAVRVQDIGALQWLLEERPEVRIQFIAETGNANLPALRRWASVIGERLDLIVLSYQLPEETIVEYLQVLPVKCEILGAGPVLLFYSPRPLLTPKIDIADGADEWLYAVSSSGESHHREFPTLENRHGTFMYLNKDQFVLDKLKVLEGAGLASVRLDLRQTSQSPRSAEGIGNLISAYEAGTADPKIHWPRPAFAPFFRRNRTTRQFSKLKPQTHIVRDERCVARVLMGRKPYQMILWALQDFKAEGEYMLALPDGTEISCPEVRFRNMRGVQLEHCKEDQLLITGWVKKCCSGALLLRA